MVSVQYPNCCVHHLRSNNQCQTKGIARNPNTSGHSKSIHAIDISRRSRPGNTAQETADSDEPYDGKRQAAHTASCAGQHSQNIPSQVGQRHDGDVDHHDKVHTQKIDDEVLSREGC